MNSRAIPTLFLLHTAIVVAMAANPTPVVPPKMQFAGMSLTIRDDARAQIQKDVDALTHSPKYFNIKVERARIYFPIIERVFQEENVPLDLMYLVLQESALIPDAVSSSNAVGYWQFKAETATDFGLAVNERVDERMNIAAASRAAARYFKKSHTYFDNWVLVVQSYQMGIGGTRRLFGEQYKGARHMDVTMETYWYVRKFLAHKVAFEDAWRGEGTVKLTPVSIARETTLEELARRSGTDAGRLREFNQWVRSGTIPGDRTYVALIPKDRPGDLGDLAVAAEPNTERKALPGPFVYNGFKVIRAAKAESLGALAGRAGIGLSRFRNWNDLDGDIKPKEGEIYYLQRKSRLSGSDRHTAEARETLWSVSQRYGLRLKTLRKLNPALTNGELPRGTTVVLSSRVRPAGGAPVNVDPSATFEWTVQPSRNR